MPYLHHGGADPGTSSTIPYHTILYYFDVYYTTGDLATKEGRGAIHLPWLAT